jgi:hypothetical protein
LVGHAFPRRNGGGGFQRGDRRRRVYRGGKTEAGRGQCCDQGALESFGSRKHFFFCLQTWTRKSKGRRKEARDGDEGLSGAVVRICSAETVPRDASHVRVQCVSVPVVHGHWCLGMLSLPRKTKTREPIKIARM